MLTNNTSINFKSTDKMTHLENGKFIGHYTKMYREDVDWEKFSKYVKTTYPDGATIDIMAGSDGSEGYSVALKLDDDKYKIKVSDFDEDSVEIAKSGFIKLNPEDLREIENQTGKEWTEYFEQGYYRVKKNLRDKVEFSEFDIKQNLNEYNFATNTVCMVRNVWYHFNDQEKVDILKTFSEKLPASSTFVIGEQEKIEAPKAFSKLVSKFFNPVDDFRNKNGPYVFRADA